MNNFIVNGGDLSLAAKNVWPQVVSILGEKLPNPIFNTWIKPLSPRWLHPNILEITAPNEYFLKYVLGHYKKDIEELVCSEGKKHGLGKVEFSYASQTDIHSMGLGVNAPEDRGLWLPPQLNPLEQLDAFSKLTQNVLQFNPNFTFENFIVGNANSFAYSAAQAFSRNDDLGNNILYILSDHGLGKSHLSQAMAQALLAKAPNMDIIYLTAEDFTNAMSKALIESSMEEFKMRFRQKCDVLVLDGVPFLGGKGKIQQEVGYTMDYLVDKGKKVVLTSTYEPKSIPKLSQSLKSRFCSSLVAPIEPPDFDMRVKILESKAKKEGIKLSEKVIEIIASNITSDVRLLEASVTTIAARCSLLHKEPDVKMARDCLAIISNTREDSMTLNRVMEFICRTFKLEPQTLTSNCRLKKVNDARNIGIYLSRILTGKTLDDIGKVFGRRHSSVIYAINKVEQDMKLDTRVSHQVDLYIGQLNNQK
ncbi:MAG: chromosomal replication initiator protein DnaA [Deltaproteobacteria bacterium]|jgi:chromosomal replication initiator protein|nr:chromosomal replication initiator protein DnaA [Deltaproteobacteria bacterium]